MVNSQRKGARVEGHIRDLFLGLGVPARRHDCYETDDLTITVHGRDLIVEVKARKAGFSTLYRWLIGRDALVVKADRQVPLLVMPLTEAVKLWGNTNEEQSSDRTSD